MLFPQLLLLATAAFLWGSAYVFIGMALKGFLPVTIVFLRCVLASVALLGLILAQGGSARRALTDLRRRPGLALLLAVSVMTAPSVLITFAQQRVPSGVTGVLVGATPIFVALFAPWLDKSERVGPRRAVGLVVGLVGVGLVVGVETVRTLGQFLSALIILVAAALFAVSGFVVKRYYAEVPPVTRAFFTVFITAIFTLIPAAATFHTAPPGASAVVGILLLGLGSTALGQLSYFALIDAVGAGRAALTTYLNPVVSLGMSALLLGEPIAPGAVVGLALILGGVGIASRPDRRSRE